PELSLSEGVGRLNVQPLEQDDGNRRLLMRLIRPRPWPDAEVRPVALSRGRREDGGGERFFFANRANGLLVLLARRQEHESAGHLLFVRGFGHAIELLQQGDQVGLDLVRVNENRGTAGEVANQTSLLPGVGPAEVGFAKAM